MLRKFTLFASFLLTGSFTTQILPAQTAGDSIFNVGDVHELYFNFSQPGFWDSLTTYYLAGNEQMLMCTAILDGDTIDSVGVRLKGNSSYNHANNKKSMIVDFNEYVSGQKWRGVKKILLNNNWSDPTMMREKLTYDLCRDIGITCPRSTYGNVYLNSSAWGLYSIVEGIDKTFLSNHFPENDGNLFKAVDAFGGGPGAPVADLKWYGWTDADYYTHYELKTNETVNDWTDIRNLIDTLAFSGTMATGLPSVINLDEFYSHLAVDIMLVNLDAYVNSARNYYLYHNLTTDKWEWIHWDANMSFGSYAFGISGVTTLSATYVSSSTNRPLINKIYGNATLKSEYLNRMCELNRDYLTHAYFDTRIDSIASVIRAHVYADTRKEYSNSQFETNLTSNITTGGGPGGPSTTYGLKDFVGSRSASITSELNSLGYTCLLSHADAAEEDAFAATVYPNPFQDEINVERLSPTSEWSWMVTDLSGNILSTGLILQGIRSARIGLETIASGMYLLVLTDQRMERHTVRITRL